MTKLRFLGPMIVLMFLAFSPLVSAEEKAAPEPPVFCPGLEYSGMPWLVVRGTMSPVRTEPGKVQVAVERVLVGSGSGNPVRFRCADPLPTDHQAVALISPSDQQRRTIRVGMAQPDTWIMRRASEKEMQVLGDVQLDYEVQTAQGIFLGREIERREGQRLIEVVRPLLGDGLKAGVRLRMGLSLLDGMEEERLKDQPPALYFLNYFEAAKDKEPAGSSRYCRPASDEAAVVASIKRRGSHPIVEVAERGQKVRRREILFRGTVSETVALLGAESPNVRLLGSRRLAYEQSKDGAFLPKLIAEALPAAGTASPTPFRELHNLIYLLGECGGQDAICRLVDQHLTYLAGNPGEPSGTRQPARQRPICSVGRDHDLIGEEDQDDVNHSLVHLLRQLNEKTRQEVYAPKLLRLRDRVRGPARREVQLALDVFGVEERIELEQAQARTKGLKPVRVRGGLRLPDTNAVAFSRDGRLLAVGGPTGATVWRTQDWSQVGQGCKVPGVQALAFSPDASLLYVGRPGWLASHDFRSGKVERTFSNNPSLGNQMELSADGKRLAILDTRDWVLVWETATGRVLRSSTSAGSGQHLTLDLEGRTLIREVQLVGPAGEDRVKEMVTGWWLETADANGPPLRDLSAKDFWVFLPRMAGQTGQHLLSLEKPSETSFDKPPAWTLRIHDATGNLKEIARREDIRFGTRLAVSADGRTLVVADHQHDESNIKIHFTVLSLPRLEILARWELRRFEPTMIKDLALSPDGRTLALALATEHHTLAPLLFETRTGQRILPNDGHPGKVQQVFFSSDGQSVRTFDDENYVCLWDARTMKLRNRVALDGAMRVVSFRDGDGKYLLCQDYRYDGEDHRYCIVDADTAGVVCTLTNFRPERDPRAFWLNERRMLLSLEKQVLHVDYMKGEIVKKVPVAEAWLSDLWKPRWHKGQLSLDYLVALGYGEDYHETFTLRFKAWSLDLDTGKVVEQGGVQLLRASGWSGSAPGDRFHYLFYPYFQLIDRRTSKVVYERRFAAGKVAEYLEGFSADGSRFVVMLKPSGDNGLNTVCVHDVETGRLLAALPKSHHYSRAYLSPDGRRLVVVMDDDALEMWDLGELDVY
jgi:WD40 repeat protein